MRRQSERRRAGDKAVSLHHSVRPTDRASAATDSADRQRWGTAVRRQNATELGNAQLSVVSCKPLILIQAPLLHLLDPE